MVVVVVVVVVGTGVGSVRAAVGLVFAGAFIRDAKFIVLA